MSVTHIHISNIIICVWYLEELRLTAIYHLASCSEAQSLLGRCEDVLNAAATAQIDGLLPGQVLFGIGLLPLAAAGAAPKRNGP